MKIEIVKMTGVALLHEANKFTTGKESVMSLKTAYRSLHSPIRTQLFTIRFEDIPLFVASQLVRSKAGVEWWMRTKRVDRGGESFAEVCKDMAENLYDRGDDPSTEILTWPSRFDRMAPTSLMCLINAEAIINMSYKRLCTKASKETREIWQKVCELIKECDPDLYPHLVPPCVAHGGICRERCCGYNTSDLGIKAIENYKKLFE